MALKLYNIPKILNLGAKIRFPCSLSSDNGTAVRRTFEVMFCSNVAERNNSLDLTFSQLESEDRENVYKSRLLKIAIIGVPNSGKSTVINQLVNRRVCSISSKVHTTRYKARAIGVDGDTQLVFLDTPGLVNSDESHRHHLEQAFHIDGETAMLEADVIGVVHDVSNAWTRDRLDPKVLRLLYLYPRKHSFLILNKVDAMKSKRKLLDVVRLLTDNSLKSKTPLPAIDYVNRQDRRKANNEALSEALSELQLQKKVKQGRGWPHFKEVFMVSALLGDGMSDIKDYLLHISVPSPWIYPASQFTDQSTETVILETIRSRLLDTLPQEIPYNLTTSMEFFDVGEEGTISAVVLVGCPTPRLEKMVVGSGGLRIRGIAHDAEQELKNTFRQTVRLKVVVTNQKNASSSSGKPTKWSI